ncbi:MAG: TolC family protein [Epsilonproteobacteria bacterium]|nr:TolC family protein [Campylobacterota bacterium]
MKALKEYNVHLSIWFSLFVATTLVASPANKFLSKEQQQTLEIEKEVNQKSATSLKYDWVEPIVASYSYSKSDQIGTYSTSKYFRISFDQPVFKSGGIYFAIQYANANRAFKDTAFKIKESALIKTLYDGVLNLKKIDLQIQKAALSVENAKIDIVRKREQFDSGLLDSSFLDQAILNKTQLEHQLLNLKATHFTTLQNFQNVSDDDYQEIQLPALKMVTQEEFITNNLDISQAGFEKAQARELKNVTIANYLPTVSLYGDYNKKDDEIQFFKQATEYKSYGARVSMPLFAVNRGRDIEIRKLEYLKSKIAKNLQQKASLHEFASIENSVLLLKSRVEIAQNDIVLYDSLVKNAEDGLRAGEKTELDLNTLQNSKEIAALDAKIYDLDIQLELLKLFVKMDNAI